MADLVAGVLALADAGDLSLGGITREDAEARRDQIIDSGREDDDALRAHELLHNMAVFGRPW